MKTFIMILGLILVSLLSVKVYSQSLPSVQTVVKNINERDEGQFVTRTITLELIDKRGKKRIQEVLSFRKYYGKERKQFFLYQNPSNIKGTAFLTYDYPETEKEDDQWLYLPAYGKTKRIPASNKGDYFLGTDLTYEDIRNEGKISESNYNYQIIEETIIDGHTCYIIEGVPKNEKIKKELGYGKIKAHIDSKIWMARKVEFWDETGNLLKTMEIKEIKKISNIWTAHVIYVKNHKTTHQSYLRFSNVDYSSTIEDYIFTQETLVNGI